MAFDRTNTIALFKNNRKRDERDPELSGQANFEGIDYWVDGVPLRDDNLTIEITFRPKNSKGTYFGKVKSNPEKTDENNKPDKVGTIQIDEEKVKIAMWRKTSEKVGGFISGTLQGQMQNAPRSKRIEPAVPAQDDFPF